MESYNFVESIQLRIKIQVLDLQIGNQYLEVNWRIYHYGKKIISSP